MPHEPRGVHAGEAPGHVDPSARSPDHGPPDNDAWESPEVAGVQQDIAVRRIGKREAPEGRDVQHGHRLR
eukprot:2403487-Pyramimonas_sp.AAC.1